MYYTNTYMERARARRSEYIVSRAKREVPKSYFPVAKIDRGMGKYSIIKVDTGDVISDVSKRYTLIKNEDIFQPFIDKFGIDNINGFIGYGKGKYSHMSIKTGRQFNFGTEEKPDIIKEQIIIENSYNKTRSFRFMFGAFRMVCSNGLYSGNCSISYRKIHVGEIPVQELIDNVINNYEKNSFELWKSFREIPMTLSEQIKMIETFEAYEIKEENKDTSKDVNRNIRKTTRRYLEQPETVDNQRNAWGLYNQLNRAIEYEVSARSAVAKRILGNINAEKYLAKSLNLN